MATRGDPTGATVELLQTLIRNRCVNDGTPSSGEEVRNADVLEQVVTGPGVELERYEPVPGRTSIVARLSGTDPTAPSLCLMGHTDVVPVSPEGWTNDPFGGELIAGPDGTMEVWGRGAVDMLNLTSSMAVAFRALADRGFRPRGDLVFFAVADEEAGSTHGARWMADHHRDAIRTDYVLTESGGLHSGPDEAPRVSVAVAEKGVAWRRLTVRGVPGHGSRPFRSDNALVTAAAVVQRLAEYRPAPRFHELWRNQVAAMGLPEHVKADLLDPERVDQLLDEMPSAALATHLHACTHTTFSPNMLTAGEHGSMKTNVIPDVIEIDVDVRTLPGEDGDDVTAHLVAALGPELFARVDVGVLMDDRASISRIDTPLWDALRRAVTVPFPEAQLDPQFMVGFTDARVFRDLGSVAYGAGLFSPALDPADFGRRFHGHDERIDVESLRLTVELWERVALDLLDRR
ncbi:MAG: M20/M25/M40 family metallo-hydrolase [Ilumatobacter sp.]|nr:MAG: M20/M25/M40 family metallo-hydrolase [Ilumatobacter sp.]